MGVVATLLKQVPAAAKYKSRLLALETELAQLRTENLRLKEELAQYLEQWETLDGPQVSTLQYLAAHVHGHATEIAQAVAINVQIADSSLTFLASHQYVQPAKVGAKIAPAKTARGARAAKAKFALAPKGERYLSARGLHKKLF